MSRFLNSGSLSWKIIGLIAAAIIILGLLGAFAAFRLYKLSIIPNGTPIAIREKTNSGEYMRYDQAVILDSSSYVIVPVVFGGFDKGGASKSSFEGYSSGVVNYLFLNKTKRESRKLFETDVQIISSNLSSGRADNYSGGTADASRILIYKVVTTDTNGDKVLNDNDYSVVFVSDLTGQKLKKISDDEKYVDYFTEDSKAQKVIIGLHDKKDKQYVLVYDYKSEMSILYGL